MRAVNRTLFLFLFLLETACSFSNPSDTLQKHVNIDARQAEIVLDSVINKSRVQVYVSPNARPQSPPSALFVPFRMTQPIENFAAIGRNVSYVVWQNWLGQGLFSVLEFSQTAGPFRPDLALAAAAEKGADFVIGGYVTEFIDGGTVGDTRVAIAIEIYDVKTKNLIWSVAQAGSVESSKLRDYVLFTASRRMPTNPSNAVINALAEDIGQTIKGWSDPQYEKTPWYKSEPKAF